MKSTPMVIFGLVIAFLAGFGSSQLTAKEPKTEYFMLDSGKVTLLMYDERGVPVQREYQGITSWAYNTVQGQPQMQLGFVNPTVYRCGFEP